MHRSKARAGACGLIAGLALALPALSAGGLGQLEPALRQALAPALAGWIVESRNAAVAHGVEIIPLGVRRRLSGYVPETVLDRVRWCANCGGPLSLQASAFRTGLTPAVTLGDVVVFASGDDARGDAKLWVHELKHVMQYEEWGVAGFATRYLDDYEDVEREAAEYRWQWMKLNGLVPKPGGPDAGG